MTALTDLSLRDVAAKIKAKDVSPVEVTQACLDRAAATEPKLSAFSCLLADSALAEAKAAEAEIAAGNWRGELHGVPVGIKELYDVKGAPTTSSSEVRANWTATSDCASVAQLRDAGTVILGKTHTHEFAYGIVTPKSRNPWGEDHSPGVSSGGSGASVAAGSTYMSMGSDTGGSIRIPAAVCGVVGLKPTFGRCSRAGVTSLSWSLDHVGPLTRTVGDAAVCLNALAGYDPRDPGSIDIPTQDYTSALGGDVKGLRIGVPTNYYFDAIDPEVEAVVRAAIDKLASEGAIISEVKIPYAAQVMAVEFAICLPEASEYHRQMLRANPDLYEDDVRTFLEAGEMVPATKYLQALRVRQLMQREWAKMYERIDVLIAPSVPATAAPTGIEAMTLGGVEMPLSAVYVGLSAPANITGMPALAVPCGFSSGNLPISFQAIARPFDEATVLRVGDAYQRMTDWGQRKPPV
ncbi:MAG: amidase [Paracoccaceae bacterium]|nr:amidase [Paracoccaceae bacterium]